MRLIFYSVLFVVCNCGDTVFYSENDNNDGKEVDTFAGLNTEHCKSIVKLWLSDMVYIC